MRVVMLDKIKKIIAKPEYVFLMPAVLFGLTSAFIMPQLSANDENMHFVRSYQLTELQVGRKCTIPADIKDRGFSQIYEKQPANFSFESKAIDKNNKVNANCGTATPYNPIMHLPQALGVFIAKITYPSTGNMVLFGRIVNILVYCAGIFFIIRASRMGKWVLVVIGLMPTLINTASSLSGDVMNNLIVLGFIVYLFNLYTQKEKMNHRQLAELIALSMLLAATKSTNVILLLLVLFLPARITPKVTLRGVRPSNLITRVGIISLAVFATLMVFTAWSAIYNEPTVAALGATNPILENPRRLLNVLYNSYINPDIMFGGVVFADWLFRSVIGSFTSFQYHLPYYLVVVIFSLMVILGLKKDSAEDKMVKTPEGVRLAVVGVASLIISIIVITYGLYTAWSILPSILGIDAKYAQGLQGRYFTPLLVLLVPLAIRLRKYVSVTFRSDILTGVVVLVVMCFALLFYILQTIQYAAIVT